MKFMQVKWVLFLILASIIVISGCGGELSVKNGDTVKVHYTGTLDDGTEFDSSYERGPLEFTVGEGKLLSGFEQAVIGMQVGQSKTVTILAEDAYGLYDDELVEVVNRDELPSDLELEIGQELTVYNQGVPVDTCTVIEISDSTVTLDYNHPLAGKDITFAIELVEIL